MRLNLSRIQLFCLNLISKLNYATSEINRCSKNQDFELVKKVLEYHPEQVNLADERGFTPLLFATYMGNSEIVDYLFKFNPHVDAQDITGNTALMGVSFKGNLEMAQLLLDHGANTDLTNKKGATALIYAVNFNQSEIVDLLLSYGADVSIKDENGFTAKDHASKLGLESIESKFK